MKYICEICNKEFFQKSHYTNHINKKNKCSKDDLIIDGKKSYKCERCKKIFNLKPNYLYHINKKFKCKEINNVNIDNNNDNDDINNNNNDDINNNNNNKIKININIKNNLEDDINNIINNRKKENKTVINEELMMEMIEELKNKLIEQSNKLTEQEKEIIELKKNGINNKIINGDNNTNNGAINNGTINNTVNNNITYVNHGKEDLSKLIKSEISEIINAGLNSVTKSVLLTHCNDRLPQYKNIRYSDTKSSYCEIIEDGEWKKNNFVIVLSELLLKHYLEVSHLSEENKDLFESKFKEKILKDHLEDYKKFIMFETEDQYPNNWNDTMKKEKQREIRKIVNRNRENIKSLIIHQTIRDKIKMLN